MAAVALPDDFNAADYLFLLDPGLHIKTAQEAKEYYLSTGWNLEEPVPYTCKDVPKNFIWRVYAAFVNLPLTVYDKRTAVLAWLKTRTTAETYSVPSNFNAVLYRLLYPTATAFATATDTYVDFLHNNRRIKNGFEIAVTEDAALSGDVSIQPNSSGPARLLIGSDGASAGGACLDVSGAAVIGGDLRVDGIGVFNDLVVVGSSPFLRSNDAAWYDGTSDLVAETNVVNETNYIKGEYVTTKCRFVQMATLVSAEISTFIVKTFTADDRISYDGSWSWSLPTSVVIPTNPDGVAFDNVAHKAVGSAFVFVGGATYSASAIISENGRLSVVMPMAGAELGGADFPWSAGDTISITLTYESLTPVALATIRPAVPFEVDSSGNVFMDGRLQFIAAAQLETYPYAATWVGGGDIGNGTLEARFRQTGCVVSLSICLAAGSTTTFGDGSGPSWSFPTPLPPSHARDIVAWARDASGALFPVPATVRDSIVTVMVGALVPFAWTTACVLTIDVEYEVSTYPVVPPLVRPIIQADAAGIEIAGALSATTLSGIGANITGIDSSNIEWAPAVVPASALPGLLSQWAPTSLTTHDFNIFYDEGNVAIGTRAATYTLNVGGSIGVTGEVLSHFSDDRLKTRGAAVTGALAKVEGLAAFTYTHNDLARSFGFKDTNPRLGLSAQDVEREVPEAVCLAPFDTGVVDGRVTSRSGENFLTVKYTALVPVLVAALQEEAKLRRDLEARLRKLENLMLNGQ